MRKSLLGFFALSALFLAPTQAWAGSYDVDVSRLGRIDGGQVVRDNAAFRSLSSEMGALIAPRPVDTSESLGLSGFALTADIGINTISYKESYWTDAANSPNGVVPTLTVTGRKGLWPGIEIGGGATKVFDSKLWGMNGYFKLSLNEGFRRIPSFSARGIFSTLLGSRDLRLTTIGIDGALSHVFGVGGTVSLTPYAGYQGLLIFSRSTLLDATPGVDEYPDGWNDPTNSDPSEFVFERQDVIVRHRPFLGLRVIFGIMRLGLEAMFAPGGNSKSSERAIAGGPATTIRDGSGFQQQYTVSLGLDF